MLCWKRGATVAALLFVLAGTAHSEQSFTGTSPTCGSISGQSRRDLRNVQSFCEIAISGRDFSEGAYAAKSLLWVKVTADIAAVMMNHPRDTERLVRLWMTGWKELSRSRAVTVTVLWRNTQVAKGQATLFRGDQVTVLGQ